MLTPRVNEAEQPLGSPERKQSLARVSSGFATFVALIIFTALVLVYTAVITNTVLSKEPVDDVVGGVGVVVDDDAGEVNVRNRIECVQVEKLPTVCTLATYAATSSSSTKSLKSSGWAAMW